MVAEIDVEKWRKKYFDSLSSIESQQKQFQASEVTLKRLVSRLCAAALGQSSRLDDQIRRLQSAIRRESTTEEFDAIAEALTDAIQSLDAGAALPPAALVTPQPPPLTTPSPATTVAAVTPAPFDEAQVRAALAAVLRELRRDTELVAAVDALDDKLSHALSVDALPATLSSLTDLVGRRIQHIERAKGEIELLLNQMVGKLDEINRFVLEQSHAQSESQASSETLNTQLVGEMRAMGESVESANDVQQMRIQVRSRLDSIDRHLQVFREREAQLAATMRAGNEHMRTRIAELETRATQLQTQLRDEQRRSTEDALTKIPNRLAYEQRMEEELQRWRRFKQPTCMAVWDVDRFKQINDTYGHRAGDRVLRNVAKCLQSRIRSTDFVARYGGEEFVMILPGTQVADAVRLADSIRSAIAQLGFHFRGTPIAITISSGVTALLPSDSAGAAFERADKALYQAKQTGRDRVVMG